MPSLHIFSFSVVRFAIHHVLKNSRVIGGPFMVRVTHGGVDFFDLELEGAGVSIVYVKVGSCFIGARTSGSGKSVHPPLGVDKVVNADGVTCIKR